MFAGLVRIESCDQDCATRFYATGPRADQLKDSAENHPDWRLALVKIAASRY